MSTQRKHLPHEGRTLTQRQIDKLNKKLASDNTNLTQAERRHLGLLVAVDHEAHVAARGRARVFDSRPRGQRDRAGRKRAALRDQMV